jgi:competence protein ComEC
MPLATHQHSSVRVPLAPIALSFAGGILFAKYCSLNLKLTILFALLFGGTSLALFWFKRTALASSSILLAALFLGSAFSVFEIEGRPANSIKRLLESEEISSGRTLELSGVINRPPEYAPDAIYLTVRVETIRVVDRVRIASGIISLSLPVNPDHAKHIERLQLRYGARVRLVTALSRSDRYRNPGVAPFTEFLDRKGYEAIGVIKSPFLITRLDDKRVFPPLAWLYEWRRVLETKINTMFDRETAGVLIAASLGNRNGLSQSTAEAFREGGTFHVLVISGLHISFIGGIVFLIARRLVRSRTAQFLLSSATLWAYTLMVGADNAVVRAAIMFSFVTLAPVLRRKAASLNSLAAAVLLLLVYRTDSLFDPGFQLTFFSVVAIVAVAWPLLARLSSIGNWRPARQSPKPPAVPVWLRELAEILYWSEKKWQLELLRSNYSYRLFKSPLAARVERLHLQSVLRYLFAAIIVSISVQLVLLPLLVLYFHRISFPSILLNLVVSVLMAAMSFAALAALVVSPISGIAAQPWIHLANWLNWLMVHSVDPFSRLGVASIRLPEYSGPAFSIYFLYYLPLICLVAALWRWDPFETAQMHSPKSAVSVLALTQALLFVVIVWHPFSRTGASGQLRVDFLDVGQGDSALIEMPDGTTLLVDGGGRPNYRVRPAGAGPPFERDTRSIGEAVVSEYLWKRGLSQLDYLLATHADADHIDGLNEVARNFQVRSALVARTPDNDPEFQKFSETLQARRIPMVGLQAGDTLIFGKATGQVLWPPMNAADNPSRNNDSLVFSITLGKRTVLLTGDIEKAAEQGLVSSGSKLKADVVKVAHHGSQTSSTAAFVKASQSGLAIISVGQTSPFGHPSKEVVARWQQGGAVVLTTGECGTITVTTDGDQIRVDTFVLPRHTE